ADCRTQGDPIGWNSVLSSYSVSDIYVVAVSEDLKPVGEPKRLTFDDRRRYGLAWTPDGGEIVFSSNRLGGHRLWRISRSGSDQPQLLAYVGDNARFPAISRRDRVGGARYSPDGNRIAFTSDHSGAYEIWVCEADGSNPMQLTSFGGPVTDHADWSPDGTRIAFHSRPEGRAEIYVIGSEGGRP
ncbi:MAG: hypothetical protein AAB225_06205, partial [Acidobacteriota bacterium]